MTNNLQTLLAKSEELEAKALSSADGIDIASWIEFCTDNNQKLLEIIRVQNEGL